MSRFAAIPAVRSEEPLLIGVIGPPGGGKSFSSLRLAKGMQAVRQGPIVVIDTEGGRTRKYADQFPFEIIEVNGPTKPHEYLEAIKSALSLNPAVVIVDSLSEEHEGEGGYLEWHDELVPMFSNNAWAAWGPPKASRKKLISGILKIKTPLIFTFRAREKTAQEGKKIVNIGWQPVAPLEIVHTLDLTCILPPKADGVPVWKSDKADEDFIIKLPNYLAPYIQDGAALNEEMGEAFARWAKGDTTDHTAAGHEAAKLGQRALDQWWASLPTSAKKTVPASERAKMKATVAATAAQQPAEEEVDVI